MGKFEYSDSEQKKINVLKYQDDKLDELMKDSKSRRLQKLCRVYFTKNPMAINYPQWITFAKYSYKQLKWVVIEKPAAREAYILGKLDESWEELEAEISDSFEDRGANEKAKANLITSIGELIRIADNKAEFPDYDNRHGNKAKNGWYRYDTRFGIPVYSEFGENERYNIFRARMLVRCDVSGRLFLYDIVQIKKE